MAIGHWNNLTEAQRLTQSQLIPGVIEEDIKRNNILDRIPVAQAQGKSIKWNREKVVLDADVAGADIGETLVWSSNVTYDPQEVELTRKYIQRVLDNFIPDVYSTVNNYEAQVLWEMKKGMIRKLGDALIYDDLTYGVKQFDGLHAWSAIQTGTNLDIDQAGALSLHNLRLQHDEMKNGIDFTYIPFNIARRIDEAYQEAGLTRLTTVPTMGMISYGVDDQGKRIMFFDGVPFLRTDFLVAENDGTGAGSNIRAKHDTGTATYSLFHIKFGDIFAGNPGLCLGFGNTEMLGQFYKLELFDKLENRDAQGFRLVTYLAPLLGSKLCLSRIYDITDVNIVF